MPYIHTTLFNPQFFFKNKHFNTLYRYLKTPKKISFNRRRMRTSDQDFMDLDFALVGSQKIIIAIHGLEGSSQSGYIHSLAYLAHQNKYDMVAVNLRGCSGEPNKNLASYHSGKTEDLHEVIQYLEHHFDYTEIYIVGYSLGGNLTLKYMGENTSKLPKKIQAAVAVSTPCDLKGSTLILSKGINRMYQMNFLKTLKRKALRKIKQFPSEKINVSALKNAQTLIDFDNYFTAPTNGFVDASDYYSKSSSRQFIPFIHKPTLLISAWDDPFLSTSCYPVPEAKASENFTLFLFSALGHPKNFS